MSDLVSRGPVRDFLPGSASEKNPLREIFFILFFSLEHFSLFSFRVILRLGKSLDPLPYLPRIRDIPLRAQPQSLWGPLSFFSSFKLSGSH